MENIELRFEAVTCPYCKNPTMLIKANDFKTTKAYYEALNGEVKCMGCNTVLNPLSLVYPDNSEFIVL